ncbi:NAD(P)-dependent oxidoreductase [Cytophagaceae bacterium ABcell3]|nr:NAD(P)-dependent oxidoreductase [Cytophagaceae bacterium ABcell3]
MNRIKCLIIDQMHDSIVPLLEGIDVQVDYRPDITREEVLNIIADYDGIIVRSKTKLDVDFFDRATHLKFIARAGAGLDQIDTKEAFKRKIFMLNASEGNRDALGEHALGMLLCLMNKMHLGDRQVRHGIWDREGNRGYEIGGKTIGLIGYGHMGRAFARKVKSFDCKVLAYDKYLNNFSDDFVIESDMEAIYSEADILSLHVPLNSETRFLVNGAYLSRFKKNIWLLNTARGEVVDTKFLPELLSSGKILGAALDVLENEKLKTLSAGQLETFKLLAASEKVLLTPHVGGWTFESYEKINAVLVKKIKEVLPQLVKR